MNDDVGSCSCGGCSCFLIILAIGIVLNIATILDFIARMLGK